MGNPRVMIVDDSAFSITFLKKMLEQVGLDVVATALNMSDAIEKAQEIKPDLITMDMTLPDGDGIACSKEILKHLKDTKIVAVSSMMDEEIVEHAKQVGISAYLQKPVEQDELKATIEKLFAGEDLYRLLQDHYEEAFKESTFNFLKREIGGEVAIQNYELKFKSGRKSSGVSVSVGIIGRHNGRLIIDMSADTALNMVKKILQDDNQTQESAIQFLGEFANVIAGNACSLLNGLNRSFGLRVSPPTIIIGEDITVSIGDMKNTSFTIKTDLGDAFMNVGIQKGDASWS